MLVNEELIEKLSHLARLNFSPAEKEVIKSDLQRMIGFVEKLRERDVAGVEPVLHMCEETNVFRPDEVRNGISTEEALSNAPDHNNMFFKVPKVINK